MSRVLCWLGWHAWRSLGRPFLLDDVAGRQMTAEGRVCIRCLRTQWLNEWRAFHPPCWVDIAPTARGAEARP